MRKMAAQWVFPVCINESLSKDCQVPIIFIFGLLMIHYNGDLYLFRHSNKGKLNHFVYILITLTRCWRAHCGVESGIHSHEHPVNRVVVLCTFLSTRAHKLNDNREINVQYSGYRIGGWWSRHSHIHFKTSVHAI